MRFLAVLAVTIMTPALSLAAPLAPAFPSDIPASFKPAEASFDFTKRIVMIPMRDGVKLNTVIMVPKGASHAPMLMERTPYSAEKAAQRNASPNLAANLRSGDDIIAVSGYIRIFQDVRGKYGSEGDYVMNRPFAGPLNPTPVRHHRLAGEERAGKQRPRRHHRHIL
jgi:predicted acyl esterase